MTQPKLRHPYEYVLPIKRADKLYKDLRNFLNPKDDTHYQHAGAWKKGLSLGFKLSVFVLAYAPGLVDARAGVSEKEWQETTSKIQKLITDAIGAVEINCETYSTSKKFQVMFDCYIAYKELL